MICSWEHSSLFSQSVTKPLSEHSTAVVLNIGRTLGDSRAPMKTQYTYKKKFILATFRHLDELKLTQ